MSSTTLISPFVTSTFPVYGRSEKKKGSTVGDVIRKAALEEDAKTGDYKIGKAVYALAAGETAVGAGYGYMLGAEHQAADVVTHETITRDVMKTVVDHYATEVGGFRYHYDFFEGEWRYSWDPLWVHEEPVYKQIPTGEKVTEVLTHHSESFPRTAVEGLIAGTIIGAVAGLLTIGAAKLYEMAMNDDL